MTEIESSDCVMNEQILNDCHKSKIVISDISNNSKAINIFYFNFSIIWNNANKNTAFQKQLFFTTIQSGKLSYIYTKLTDKPSIKKIEYVHVVMVIRDTETQIIINPCPSHTNPNMAQNNCYYILTSDYYIGLRISAPVIFLLLVVQIVLHAVQIM